MLTYLLHDRIFRSDKTEKLSFPNQLKVYVKLAPPESFGTKDGYSRLILHNRKASLLWNANTGRVVSRSDPPLEPLEVILESPNTRFSMSGDSIEYNCPCEDLDHLIGCLNGFQYVLPAFLNIKFPDPPVVEHIKGSIGGVDFRWEHREMAHAFRTLTVEILEKHVVDSMNFLQLFHGAKNRRLLAAIHYFYICSRLLVAGHSQWEFMAEGVLNLCKALEILFGRSKDAVRNGLQSLGYTTEEVEGDYIPLFILRDSLDIAHPRIAIFKPEDLRTLYMFLFNSEDRFRNLFERALKAVEDSSFELPQEKDLRLGKGEQTKMNRLMNTLSQRNPQKSK